MLNKSKMRRYLSLSLVIAGFVLVSGHFAQTDAQVRDPFEQPEWKKPKTAGKTVTINGVTKPVKPGPPPIAPVLAPGIEQRIAYYKQLRENAAVNGQPIPKVTSVLTLDEMSVTGIFRTPRGYAAMVEATPIKLSYTIYPGEKFFDGQLVAIEENRLVLRKVVKMTNGKFVASVENKTLRQYTVQQEIQGTAPVEPNAPSKTEVVTNTGNTTSAAATTTAQADGKTTTPTPAAIVSPVDEMNRQPAEKPEDSVKDKNSKKTKKPVKVAKKS
jgi:hypothetical protein